MTTTETPWSVRPESMDPCGGGVQASTNMSLVGSNRGNTNTSGSEPMQNSSMNSRASLGSIMGSQSRHGRKRSFSPRDPSLHGRNSSGRHGWNRQPFFDGGSNGFSVRSPKGR